MKQNSRGNTYTVGHASSERDGRLNGHGSFGNFILFFLFLSNYSLGFEEVEEGESLMMDDFITLANKVQKNFRLCYYPPRLMVVRLSAAETLWRLE